MLLGVPDLVQDQRDLAQRERQRDEQRSEQDSRPRERDLQAERVHRGAEHAAPAEHQQEAKARHHRREPEGQVYQRVQQLAPGEPLPDEDDGAGDAEHAVEHAAGHGDREREPQRGERLGRRQPGGQTARQIHTSALLTAARDAHRDANIDAHHAKRAERVAADDAAYFAQEGAANR